MSLNNDRMVDDSSPSDHMVDPSPGLVDQDQMGGNPDEEAMNGGAESETSIARNFSERSIRHKFIRKVYSILMVQLLITAGFIALFLLYQPLQIWIIDNSWFVWVVVAVSIVILFTITCFPSIRRKFPLNIIFLLLFTVTEGVLVGVVCSFYDTEIVLIAAGVTSFLCLAITIFAFQTKIDFTGWGIYLFVALIVVGIFGIIAYFLSNTLPILNMVYSCLGAMLFSFYLIFDTQLIIGGKHKNAVSPEEYIHASLSIYLDIINIFLCLLRVVSGGNRGY